MPVLALSVTFWAYGTTNSKQQSSQVASPQGKNGDIIMTLMIARPKKKGRLTDIQLRLRIGNKGNTLINLDRRLLIPIIMTQDPDPIGNGFVVSLARPGGNITGLSNYGPELSGKRLELLKEIVPRLTRVAVFGTSTFPGNAQILKETERAAGALRVQLHYHDVLEPKDIETAFRGASKARAEAVLVLAGPVFTSERTQLASLAVKSRLPAMYPQSEYVEDGGLMTYGPSINDLFRRAATYVDKILKGAKPADLPVEQPKKFEFIINLKTAKQIGLTIPPNVLARADKVIK